MDCEDQFESGFDYDIQTEGMRQGAEARIYTCTYLGRPAVMKERFVKKYRHSILDQRLNKTRMRNELKGMVKAQELGISTPAIYFVDSHSNKIIMQRIEGCTANHWIETRREKEGDSEKFLADNLAFGKALGVAIARMHLGNLVHGDLTTSNVILKDDNFDRPIFIDFGLASLGKVLPEDKGVDLYVLERAMISTHINSETMFESVLEGYRSYNAKQADAVLKKLDEIRLRGRKRDMTG